MASQSDGFRVLMHRLRSIFLFLKKYLTILLENSHNMDIFVRYTKCNLLDQETVRRI